MNLCKDCVWSWPLVRSILNIKMSEDYSMARCRNPEYAERDIDPVTGEGSVIYPYCSH